ELEFRQRIAFVESDREHFVRAKKTEQSLRIISVSLLHDFFWRLIGSFAYVTRCSFECGCANLLKRHEGYGRDPGDQCLIDLQTARDIRGDFSYQRRKIKARGRGRRCSQFADRRFDLRPVSMPVKK